MNSAIYRDSVVVAESRRTEALRRWRSDAAAVPEAVKAVYGRRAGRTAAGLAAMVVAGAVVGSIFQDESGTTGLLLLAGPCALLAYVAGRVWGAFHVARLIARGAASTSDVWADLERLERSSPLSIVQEAADRLERASVALPMIGLALCAPLTLHFVYFVFNDRGHSPIADFDGWIRLSALVVGHCHLILVALCWRFASRMRTRPTADLAWAPGRDGWGAWGITIATSTFPGVALLFVPVFLVAVTGVLFIPLMFRFMSLRVSRERLTLVEPHDALAYA